MSYNNSSYYKGGASGMNRGGRGGGSFRSRGVSDSGSSWQSRGRGRGGFSSGATRGSSTNWYHKSSTNFNKSYNDRNSSGNRDNNDRFSSRGSDSDYSHRYGRQGNVDNYSARNDHSHHRTPEELPRKRMRTDSYSGDANRRGHDGGFDSYGSNRYDTFNSDKSNFGEDRVRTAVYRDDRRPSATRRDDFSQRPRETSSTSMPPPSQAFRTTTFRGRGAPRGRGVTRGGFARRQDTFVSPRSRLVDSFKAKKRLVMSKPDFFKTKLQKLRSFGVNRGTRKELKPRDAGEEENWSEEVADKDTENGEGAKEKLPEKKKRPVKIVKKIIKKVVVKKEAKPSDGTPADAEATETKEESKELVKEAQEEVEQELEEGEEEGEEEEIVEEELEVEEEEEELDEKDGGSKSDSKVTLKEGRTASEERGKKAGEPFSRSYIKLKCPRCHTSCLTFKDYHDHLRSSRHICAMREVSLDLKTTLMRMRHEQRHKQRKIEEAEELKGVSSAHTNFCPTCKLNYRQDRERHITSEMHKKMKDYLMPFCNLCRISFKSPMLYENHICSLEHIRAKDIARKAEPDKGSLDDEKDVDMDDLLILDSVGSADESAESDQDADNEKVEGSKGKKKEKKNEINLGADYVRKVQVMYCDLCEMYLPRREPPDTALTSHCRTRNHLQRYVRYRDDCHLRREAERIHRRDQAEQEARTKALKDNEDGAEKKTDIPEEATEKAASAEKPEETKDADTSVDVKEVIKEPPTPNVKSESSETTIATAQDSSDIADSEDKMWADVDKGLDELLREVAPGCKSSDEDEDSGRYDRFKHSKDEAAAVEAEKLVKKEEVPEKSEPAAE